MAELGWNDVWRNQGVNVPSEPVQNTPQATTAPNNNRVDSFGQMFGNMGIQSPTNFDTMYGNRVSNPVPGSAVPAADPNTTNINPATGRPYSFTDSLNDADGQLMYDPSQSMMWNVMNGRFRTQGDNPTGLINPMTQENSGFAQGLQGRGMLSRQLTPTPSSPITQPQSSPPNRNAFSELFYERGLNPNTVPTNTYNGPMYTRDLVVDSQGREIPPWQRNSEMMGGGNQYRGGNGGGFSVGQDQINNLMRLVQMFQQGRF